MNRDHLVLLKERFSAYCRSFYYDDVSDQRNIALKEEHTRKVCAIMRRLADSIGLDEAETSLAEAIALFHDVGRFAQYRDYRTFKDSESVNHAALGARILREEGLLDDVPDADRATIIRAVALHNVFLVPENLDPQTLLYLKLIRDADKLDIWRVFIEHYTLPEDQRASAVSLGFADLPVCSPEVVACLEGGRMVNLSMLNSLTDFKLLQISWVYDLNFPESYRLVLERGYVEAIVSTIPSSCRVEKVKDGVLEYLRRKVAEEKTAVADERGGRN